VYGMGMRDSPGVVQCVMPVRHACHVPHTMVQICKDLSLELIVAT